MGALARLQGRKGLPQSATQERYGIAYLSSICAEAGVTMNETRPGEDHHATDAYVHLSRGLVSVQVKCTTKQFTSTAPRHLNWGIKPEWWEKWCMDSAPVFVLVVQVPPSSSLLIDHTQDDVTTHHAAGYWLQIDKSATPVPKSISLQRGQRFTKDTIQEWDLIHRKGLGLL